MAARRMVIVAVLCAAPFFTIGRAAMAAEEAVTIGMSPSITSTLFFIAENKGYFTAQGLKVTMVVNPAGGNALVDEMLKGNMDLVSASGYRLVTESFRRKDIKIVGTTATSINDNMVVARRDSGIREVKDLKGKRVGVNPTGMPRYSLDLLLMRHGLKTSDIIPFYGGNEESVKKLVAGDIDAAGIFGIHVVQAQMALRANAVTFAEEMLVRITAILMATDGTIRARPAMLNKVLQALIQAEAFVKTSPDAALAIVAQYLGTDAANLRPQWGPSNFRVALDQSLVIDLENIARWQLESGLAKAPGIPNYLDFIHFGSLDALDARRVTIIH